VLVVDTWLESKEWALELLALVSAEDTAEWVVSAFWYVLPMKVKLRGSTGGKRPDGLMTTSTPDRPP
jgi:hypothetical protein